MINLLIVEDNQNDLENCEKLIRNINSDVRFFKTTSGLMAYQIIANNKIDAALIDINIPEMNGYELAYRLRKISKTRFFPIVFITATESDTLEVYRELHHNGYIQKPYSELEFNLVIEPFLNGIEAKNEHSKLSSIVIDVTGGKIKVDTDEILYVETISRKTNIITFDNRYEVYRKNLSQVINDINNKNFIRCQRKCYANLEKIYSIYNINYRSCDIHFTKDGSIKCPLGYKYKELVIHEFERSRYGK